MNLTPTWTDERVDQLRQLWTEGYSITEIAGQFGNGITRNAVIGKVQRLGLPARKTLSAAPKAIRYRKRAVRMGLPSPTRLYAKAPPRPLPPPVIIEANPRGVTLLDLQSGDCRWPMGDPRDPGFLYCGDSVRDGSSYCAAHHAIAYTPSTNRRPGKGDVRSTGGERYSVPASVNF